MPSFLRRRTSVLLAFALLAIALLAIANPIAHGQGGSLTIRGPWALVAAPADGTPQELVAELPLVQSIHRWNATQRSFESWRRGAPAFANSLSFVRAGDGLWVRLDGTGGDDGGGDDGGGIDIGGGGSDRGYLPRPCGFDLNDNGIIGEPADCNIGDGVTLDPDGDGVNEDIVYVDCGNGSDTAGNGSAQNPWRTIQFADSQLDGPGDGAEDIIAFRGICSLGNNFSPSVAGVPGARVKPPSGSEQWAFEFPTNPAMLIGWDFDNDGQYPPFDTDDIAVLDGNGASRAFLFNNPDDNSYYELAHFRAESYGSPDGRSGGFLKPSAFPSDRSHLYLHDLSVRDTNRGRGLDGRRNVINFFNIQNFHYMALINIEFLDTGGFFSRGGGREDGSPAAQYFRFQNISYTAHGCDNPGPCDNAPAGVAVSKIWGYIDHFEWIDSEWDANVREWSPQESGGPAGAGGIVPAQCSQDWIVRNNTFIDFKSIVTVQPESSGSCLSAPRPVRNVTVDSNLVINTWPNWRFGDIGIQVRGGAPDARSAAVNITITNNVMVSEPGVEAFIRIQTGTNSGTQTGTVTIVGNTFYGPVNRFSAIHIADPGQSSRQESFLIRNNIFAGGAVDRAITTEYAPNMWRTDFNVFPSNSRFGWNDGSGTDLAGWRNQSGGDGNSPSCDPLFVNINSADFHLTASDTCARDAGTPVGSVPAVDFEGDSRPPGGPWDIGADEFRS